MKSFFWFVPFNRYSNAARAVASILPAALLLAISLSVPRLAEAAAIGTVRGTVVDPSSARVAGATVTLSDTSGRTLYETRTDRDGSFEFASVPDGKYELTARADGLSQQGMAAVEVRNSDAPPIEVKLTVAAVSDQMVVTATRTETPINELGGSASVITSHQLQRMNQSSVAESLRLVPGLAVVQSGGRGTITSIFAEGGDSDYNKVLIDGIPVNVNGGSFDFSSLTPENLDRIEVVRGPESALFGSDAMTSAIQLFTRRGSTQVPEFEFSGEGGSFDFHRETALLSGAVGRFDYSTSFGFLTTAGRFQNSDFTNRSLSGNFGFRISPDASLRIISRWNDNSLGVPGPTAVLFSDPDERQKHHDLALSGTLDFKAASRWRHSVSYIYSESDTNSFDPVAQDLTVPGTPPLAPGAFGLDFVSTFIDHEKRSGVHYQTIAELSSTNVLTGGVDFEHESAVLTSFDQFSGSSRVGPSRNNVGIYLQDQAGIRDRLFVTLGVRAEHNSARVPDDLRAVLQSISSAPVPIGQIGFGWTANPKLAVSFLARRTRESGVFGATRLKASFGTGIKEPTLTQAFSPSISFLGNPALDPERAISFNTGIVQELFGRRGSIEVTYYDNRFRNQIVFEESANFLPIQLPDGRLTDFVNANRSSARGIEVIGSIRPADPNRHPILSRLQISGSYTFLRSRLDDAALVLAFPPPTFAPTLVPDPQLGLPLLRRPRNSGTFIVSWVDRRFDLTLDGSIVGARRDADPISFAFFDASGRPIFNNGYAKLDWNGAFHINQTATLFARIDNLLNQNYQEVLGFPAYRLTFSAGLRVRIGGGR